MAETEASASVSVSVGGGLLPVGAAFTASMSRRFGERGLQALQPAVDAIGEAELLELLGSNEELEAMVVRAMTTSAESANSAKRALLASVVRDAVMDDAKVDEAALLVGVLRDLESAHIRCLEEIQRAQLAALASGEMAAPARGAQRELTQAVRQVVARYPDVLLRQLERLGLLDGTISWDGQAMITGTTSFGARLIDDLRGSDEAQSESTG